MSLTPLSSHEKTDGAPVVQTPQVLTPMPPSEQAADMDGKTFFTYFARLLASNPPAAADAAIMTKLASLGIVPGRDFDFEGLDPVIQDGISRSVGPAQTRIRSFSPHADADPSEYYLSRARRAAELVADVPPACRMVENRGPTDSTAEKGSPPDRLEPEDDISVENGILFKAEGHRRAEVGFDIREDIERGQEFLRDKIAGCSQRV